MRKAICISGLALLVLLVFVCSWKSSPDFQEEWYMPAGLVQWSNEYGRLRTAVPFVLIGIVLSFFGNNYKKYLFGMLVLVIVAEVGQLRLPNRHFDWMDIFYGVLGGILGMMIGRIIVFLNYK